MDELGHILREARESKGLTLKEIQEETRISVKFLLALEDGNYAALPTPVHVRGYLRNYARYLGLDPQPLLDRYELNKQQREPDRMVAYEPIVDTVVPVPQQEDQPFFDPVNMEVDAVGSRAGNPEGILRLVIIMAAVVALGLIANRFLPLLQTGNETTGSIVEEITAAFQEIVGDDGELDLVDVFTPTPVLSDDPLLSTSRNDLGEAAPTSAPTRPPLPATVEEIDLIVEILERTWMEITIDGDVVFTGIARVGDSFEYNAQDEARILTGNAVGVFVTFNDIPWGRLGSRGESVEQIWETTQ